MVNEWAAGGEYSPQGKIGHYSQRIEHEWRCENSLPVQREVGGMEWTGHGNMNWCLLKGWASHLCLGMPWLRAIFLSFLTACLSSVHLHLFKNKDRGPKTGIYHGNAKDLFSYPTSATHHHWTCHLALLSCFIIEYVLSEDLLNGLISIITSFWK